jgi:hypothetical protein
MGSRSLSEHLGKAAVALGVSSFALALLLAGAEPEELATALVASLRGSARLRFAKRPKWRIRTKPSGRTWMRKRRRNLFAETVMTFGLPASTKVNTFPAPRSSATLAPNRGDTAYRYSQPMDAASVKKEAMLNLD